MCTGNVCRSPYVQLTLQRSLADRSHLASRIASAGTHAMAGSPVAPEMSRLLRQRGIDSSDFRARQLTDEHVRTAALVVTATRQQRSDVARTYPRVLPRLFTLRQLARLIESTEPSDQQRADDPVTELAERCSRARGTLGPSQGDRDDVPDPWGGSRRDYLDCVSLLDPAVEHLSRALGSL